MRNNNNAPQENTPLLFFPANNQPSDVVVVVEDRNYFHEIALEHRGVLGIILGYYLSSNAKLDSNIRSSSKKIATLMACSKILNAAIRRIIFENPALDYRIFRERIFAELKRKVSRINLKFNLFSGAILGSLSLVEPSLMASQFQQAFVSNWPSLAESAKWGYSLSSSEMYPDRPNPFANFFELYPVTSTCLGTGNTSTWTIYMRGFTGDPGSISDILDRSYYYTNGGAGFWFANFGMMFLTLLMFFLTFRSFSNSSMVSIIFGLVAASFNVMTVMVPFYLTNAWASSYALKKLCSQIPAIALTDIPFFMPNLPPLPWPGYSPSPLPHYNGTLFDPKGILTQLGSRFGPESGVLSNAGVSVSIGLSALGIFCLGAAALAKKYFVDKEEKRAQGREYKN